jgi:molybdopterin molybdotransferase
MLDLEQALQNILAGIAPLPEETVPVSAGTRRVLSEAIHAPVSLPPFDNSAMDGFAVQARDTAGAAAEIPVLLQLKGAVAAGDAALPALLPGTCLQVFTGAPLPGGADAVVMQEDTAREAGQPGLIRILEPVKPWENVRFSGEDIKQAEQVFQTGESMTSTRLGLLAALGIGQLKVRRQPVIGLLATGSELTEPGQPLAPGKIYESNRTMLAALLEPLGAIAKVYPIIPDTKEATQAALQTALAECDAILSTGGVSVGEKDFVKSAFAAIGGCLNFWKVAIKPGKPFVCGTWQNKWFFGLPGNPVSAFVTFLLLVRPAIRKLQGAAELSLTRTQGTLLEPLVNQGNRRHFMRVHKDSHGRVSLAGLQASHILRSLANANGLVDVPPEQVLPAGTQVEVLSWGE